MRRLAGVLAAAAAMLFQVATAGATIIEEISVSSVDTSYAYVAGPITDSTLTIEQSGVTVVVERPGNVQEYVSGAFFSMVTNLKADNSTGGQAAADFEGGSIIIKDAADALLLSAETGWFSMEENAFPYFCVLTGAGTFTVTGGAWAGSFGPKGLVFDLTWQLDTNIDNFGEGFTAESDVTLIPEPATVGLLVLGGIGACLPRRRARRAK